MVPQPPPAALPLPLTMSSTCGPDQTVLKQNSRMGTGKRRVMEGRRRKRGWPRTPASVSPLTESSCQHTTLPLPLPLPLPLSLPLSLPSSPFPVWLVSALPHRSSPTLPCRMTCLSYSGPQVMVLLQCPGRNSRETHQDQRHEHEQAKQAVFPGHGPLCAHTAHPATLGTHSRPAHL